MGDAPSGLIRDLIALISQIAPIESVVRQRSARGPSGASRRVGPIKQVAKVSSREELLPFVRP